MARSSVRQAALRGRPIFGSQLARPRRKKAPSSVRPSFCRVLRPRVGRMTPVHPNDPNRGEATVLLHSSARRMPDVPWLGHHATSLTTSPRLRPGGGCGFSGMSFRAGRRAWLEGCARHSIVEVQKRGGGLRGRTPPCLH
eukprot:356913-Chlamydomonas_euryale.AAC.4